MAAVMQQPDAATYTFQSKPKAVEGRRKYRFQFEE